MRPFSLRTLPSEVVFGDGALARLPEVLDRLGLGRALLLTTPGQRHQVEALSTLLGARLAGAFTEARMHVPVATVAAGRAAARAVGADCTVAFGGGSTIGLGKALSLDPGLPQVAIDTTYAGSSRTAIWGLTEAGPAGSRKVTGVDERVLPRAVIYDPRLTHALPPRATAASGLNAMAHCLEALYARDENPVTSLLAEEGLRALGQALPRATRDPGDAAARSDALYGAFLAGTALGTVGMALHHKLCHVLGGSFDLPHAETHAVVLPHVVRFNEAHAAPAMARAARALGTDDAAARLFALLGELGLPRSLADLGLREEALDRAAQLATSNPYWNPRPVVAGDAASFAAVRGLLADAFAGRLAPRAAA